MSAAFQEIGQVCVSMACGIEAADKMCKVSGNGAVSPCAAGDKFCGKVVSHRGGYGAVLVRGFVTADYTGTAPGLGFAALSANGSGGVKADSNGNSYLVVDCDSTAKTVTFLL